MLKTRVSGFVGAGMAAILWVGAQPALAQSVSLDFAPDPGAAWKVSQTSIRTKSKEGSVPTTGTVTGTLRVVEETDEGYLMEWTTDSVAVGNVVVRDMPEMMVGVPIRFDADESGMPVRVHDAQQILDTSLAMISGQSQDVKDRTRAMFAGMDPETLAEFLLKDAAMIAQCHDYELEIGDDLTAEFETPNALGGPPIKTNYFVKLEDAGSASAPARIRIEQAYDPESAAASIYETMKSLSGKPADDPSLVDGKLPLLNMRSSTLCHVDLASATTVSVVYEREASVGPDFSGEVRSLKLEPL